MQLEVETAWSRAEEQHIGPSSRHGAHVSDFGSDAKNAKELLRSLRQN